MQMKEGGGGKEEGGRVFKIASDGSVSFVGVMGGREGVLSLLKAAREVLSS